MDLEKISSQAEFKRIAEIFYDNPECVCYKEFEQDLRRVNSLSRLLEKYYDGEEVSARLLLNQVIVLYNLFGRSTNFLVDFKVPKQYLGAYATISEYLGKRTEIISGYEIDENLKLEIERLC